MPYTAEKPTTGSSSEELRQRIPGWGADLDIGDRPSVPQEDISRLEGNGAHWHLPERQVERWPRERSIEHGELTAVFGTSCPPRGLSGVIRRAAYERYGEGRAAHWLLLLVGDRVDAWEHHLRSLATLRPDNPVTQTGIRGELGARPLRSRLGRARADLAHQPLDAAIVAGPWLVGGYGAYRLGRWILRSVVP